MTNAPSECVAEMGRGHAAGDPLGIDVRVLLAALGRLKSPPSAEMQTEGLAATIHPARAGLLMPEEAASRLSVSVRWLYRHAGNLPFTRKLSRKVLRFDEAGLERWLKDQRP